MNTPNLDAAVAQLGTSSGERQARAAELAMLKDDLRRTTEALKFYSMPQHYHTVSTGFAAQYDPEPTEIAKDGGKRAREALLRIDR